MRSKKAVSKRVNPTAGLHVARLKQILDYGLQVDKNNPEPGVEKVEFVWELPEELHTFKEDLGEQPLHVSRLYVNQISKKTFLGIAIKGMTGQDWDPEEDLDTLLDKLCQLHIELEEDGEYTNAQIKTILPLSKDQQKKKYPTYSDAFVFDMSSFDQDIFDSLPEWKQKKIQKSKTYAEALADAKPKAKVAAKATPAPAASKAAKELFKAKKK